MSPITGRNAGGGRLFDAGVVVVPADDVGTAGKQRARCDQAGFPEPEHGDFLPGECGDRDHGVWLGLDRFVARA
jgi:hypothetical protein